MVGQDAGTRQRIALVVGGLALVVGIGRNLVAGGDRLDLGVGEDRGRPPRPDCGRRRGSGCDRPSRLPCRPGSRAAAPRGHRCRTDLRTRSPRPWAAAGWCRSRPGPDGDGQEAAEPGREGERCASWFSLGSGRGGVAEHGLGDGGGKLLGRLDQADDRHDQPEEGEVVERAEARHPHQRNAERAPRPRSASRNSPGSRSPPRRPRRTASSAGGSGRSAPGEVSSQGMKTSVTMAPRHHDARRSASAGSSAASRRRAADTIPARCRAASPADWPACSCPDCRRSSAHRTRRPRR